MFDGLVMYVRYMVAPKDVHILVPGNMLGYKAKGAYTWN